MKLQPPRRLLGQQTALKLEQEQWLDENSEQLEVRFLTFNAPLDLLMLTNINFVLASSGHIWKGTTHVAIVMENHRCIGAQKFVALRLGKLAGWHAAHCC